MADYATIANEIAGGSAPVHPDHMGEVLKLLVTQLGKSEPVTPAVTSPVSSALAGAGGTGLGLTPEQVSGGFAAALGSAGADVEYSKQALARQLAPTEQFYKTAQGIKAVTDAGLAERETRVKENKLRLEALGSDMKFIEDKSKAEAKGKGMGENAAEEMAAKNMDTYAAGKGIGPVIIPTADGKGISMSLGTMYRMRKDPGFAAWMKANSEIVSAQITGKSRTDAASIGAAATVNLDKINNMQLRTALQAVDEARKVHEGNVANINTPFPYAETLKSILDATTGKAGIKPSTTPMTKVGPDDLKAIQNAGLQYVRETPTGVIVRDKAGKESEIPFKQ